MGNGRRSVLVTLVATGVALITLGAARLPAPAESAAVLLTDPLPWPKTAPDHDSGRDQPVRLEPVDTLPAQSEVVVPFASGRLDDRKPVDKPLPVALRIRELDVTAPIVAMGGSVNGEMEVPATIDDVAWYRHGPSPGQGGSAVLAAHVDLAGQGPGVFADLAELTQGSIVEVDFADGDSQRFVVVDGAVYGKDNLDSARIFAREGPPMLTLITCGGSFNPSLSRYDSNVVVFAMPLDAVGGPAS